MAPNIKTIPTSEYQVVKKTVQRYVEGAKAGSPSRTVEPFHRDATMYGYYKGELTAGPIKNLYNYIEKFGSSPDMNTHLDVLAITPTTAVVKVEMEGEATGTPYTDFHTLIKLDGIWTIIAKVFHAYDV
ncbi:hypothetical protein Asppvi_003471 [Aspergillus pseudoviridinutans]|uniref:Lumazine-binding protein n=1 Tax=Aspergillus pseudoviridinutans TaxID=1517512 RepID=A0A9P3ESD8_9EURO|nr:uncharacterized protein Asppvi_003471 [Aspergillus pseudoviridinutans]GIJ84622.1 hypothetical protein Asppvi_003471 [Aspergillus pseudoviridinutans]